MIKKIGFSASRCVRDIVEDVVNLRDVVMITTGTDCPTLESWLGVMRAYASLPIWDDRSLAGLDPEKVTQVAETLWHQGKVHQPRTYGGHRTRSPYAWMDLVHTKEDRDSNPALAKAWEQAQMIEGLVAAGPADYEIENAAFIEIFGNARAVVPNVQQVETDEDKPSK